MALYDSCDEELRAIMRTLVEAHIFVGPHRGRTFHDYESAVVSRIAVTMPWLVDDAVATLAETRAQKRRAA